MLSFSSSSKFTACCGDWFGHIADGEGDGDVDGHLAGQGEGCGGCCWRGWCGAGKASNLLGSY